MPIGFHGSLRRSLGGLLIVLTSAVVAVAGGLRALPEGQLPHDQRLGSLKTLDGYFPFSPCDSPQAWARRSGQVRRQVLVATGLWPMPTRTPANAVVHGAVARDGYTVEKVYLESYPGHFVTGNLYRPAGRAGRRPAVLCPHGHWANGRFHDAGPEETRRQIAQGAEKYEVGGRHPLQARCVQLARMGCVVFHYDMVGYADSVQLPHRPGVREKMNAPSGWGFFSPQAEARLQSMMGLQTYNSICALDFLSGLADVDPQRIAVTGASGGGTQTFILCALDPRPAVAFPAVMVSTAMQGGCTCENACYLRIGTGNVELAAMFSPRPLGMTAANDWTKEIATKGLPELKRHYAMLGIPDLVMATPLTQFGHNYNDVSRAVMYGWLDRHLALGCPEPIVERDYQPLTIEEMSVGDDAHPKPAGGEAHERALLKWMTDDAARQMAALVPNDAASLEEFRRIVGGAVEVMIGRGLPELGAVEAAAEQSSDRGDYCAIVGLLRYAHYGEEVTVVRLVPKSFNGRAVVWLDRQGKQGLFDAQGRPLPAVAKLLAAGVEVVGIDLFGQGEFTADGKPLDKARMDLRGGHGPASACYTFGYNHPVFAQRVHDVLSAISYLRSRPHPAKQVGLVGLAGAGPWAAAARARAGGAVDRAAVDTQGFRFAGLTAIDDPDFLPGAAKYLDLPGLLALSAGHPLWLAGEDEDAAGVVTAAYRAAGAAAALSLCAAPSNDRRDAAVAWLLQ